MEKTFTFVKNVRGGLTIGLDSFDMQLPTRDFVIPFNIERVVIPYQYALGLFISPSALAQYRLGYFTIEKFEDLVKDGIEKGLCAETEFPEVKKLLDIEKMVKGNQSAAIRKVIKSEDQVAVENLINVARENIGTLNTANKKIIEEQCGVELEIE